MLATTVKFLRTLWEKQNMSVNQRRAAGCRFCNLSCRPSFCPRSFRQLRPSQSPLVPILSAVIYVLDSMHKPHARPLTQAVPAQVGHSNTPQRPNSKKLKFPGEREYGKCPRKGVKKPELVPALASICCVTLGNRSLSLDLGFLLRQMFVG